MKAKARAATHREGVAVDCLCRRVAKKPASGGLQMLDFTMPSVNLAQSDGRVDDDLLSASNGFIPTTRWGRQQLGL